MTTTFLLDLRKLDGVESKVREAEIQGQAVAYYIPTSKKPHYAFYVDEVDVENISIPLLKLRHSQERSNSELHFHYLKASVLFLPFSDAPRFQNGSTPEAWKAELMSRYEALYVQGKFLKGDEQTLRNYGVRIKYG